MTCRGRHSRALRLGRTFQRAETPSREGSHLTDMAAVYPFSAIVGQDEMKLAILIAAVDPSVGGVLILGDRGSGKSTAVRALASLLPKIPAVLGCRFSCDPADEAGLCEDCRSPQGRRPAQDPSRAGPFGRPSARRDRRPGRRRARSGAGADPGHQGVRAGPPGARTPRVPVHRRSQSAGRLPGRPAARCGRIRRKCCRARGLEHPPSGAVCPGRHR